MKRFPERIREAMAAGGASVTCTPICLDLDAWETAVYFQVSGPECKHDRRVLTKGGAPVPVGIETDLIEHQHASVVILRFEVHTVPADPLAGETLITPGASASHFDTLKLLTRQPRLCWFFGDQHYWIIHSQQHPLSVREHRGFVEVLNDAVRHDALVRMSGRYDANAALGEIASRYELRAGATRAGHGVARTRN